MVVQVANIVGEGEVKQHSDRVDVDLPCVLLIPVIFHLVKADEKKTEMDSQTLAKLPPKSIDRMLRAAMIISLSARTGSDFSGAFAERRTHVLQRFTCATKNNIIFFSKNNLTLTALMSALLSGFPFIMDIFGMFLSNPHSRSTKVMFPTMMMCRRSAYGMFEALR